MTDLRQLRVIVVAPPYFEVPPRAYGGVEAVVADLVDALIDRGHDLTLLGAGHADTAAAFVPLWDRTIPEVLGQPLPEVAHAVKVRRAVAALAAQGAADIVHDHTLSGALNAPIYRQLGLPTVVTVHGLVDQDVHDYYRDLGDDIDLVAISERQRDLAPGLNWVGRVHNAIRLDDWPFEACKEHYALFLGRFAPEKAPHLALQAAHDADIPLILAGKCDEPPEKAYFSTRVQPLLTVNDYLYGQADATAKRALLTRARCLVFPSQWEEPFGMVMIEAMACGTPVVALRCGAVPEIVHDGVTGFICDDPTELAAAIARTQHLDPAACRRHVKENFSAEQMALGYENIYRRVLAEPMRPEPPLRAAG
ncbi:MULTISPECIES: glycosyltransferase family 4 protein [Mycobacteriaceae]|uniref:Glycosyltransferase family 4 protein n=1 Tax=Mycolicibacterium austroafricanum TaxID=39687 RepID=A0ABT8H8Y3_MYCAO|nr:MULTISPECIES: glycosyltransferase family 4 protein [Mycobacteriaceae]MDN4517218.1 glycosyltransferase family 4 protein [Mycolicibacterium austroafricanum]